MTEPKAHKPSMTDAAMEAAKAGRMPEPITFPASNSYAQKHVEAMIELARADNKAAVEAYAIKGTNTYSKALRRFREALLVYLSQPIPLPIKKKKGAAKKDAA